MGRLVNNTRRVSVERPLHVGKLLIFCEGSTEYNYFEYLNQYLKNNVKARYSELVIEQIKTLNTEGNAQNVLNYANDFLENGDNAQKYSLFEKHLVFDCDAPKDIQSVIQQMKDSIVIFIVDSMKTTLAMRFLSHCRGILL